MVQLLILSPQMARCERAWLKTTAHIPSQLLARLAILQSRLLVRVFDSRVRLLLHHRCAAARARRLGGGLQPRREALGVEVLRRAVASGTREKSAACSVMAAARGCGFAREREWHWPLQSHMALH
jgi:hypothetical protein